MEGDVFKCKNFGGLEMPADRQRGFCAMQYRKGREICVDCDRGKEASKEEAAEVRSTIQTGPQGGLLSRAKQSQHELRKSQRKEDKTVGGTAKKKTCVDCGNEFKPTSNVQKRCPECGPAAKKKRDKARLQAGMQSKKAATGKRPGAAGTGYAEDARVIEILIAAGAVTQKQVDAARQLAA